MRRGVRKCVRKCVGNGYVAMLKFMLTSINTSSYATLAKLLKKVNPFGVYIFSNLAFRLQAITGTDRPRYCTKWVIISWCTNRSWESINKGGGQENESVERLKHIL